MRSVRVYIIILLLTLAGCGSSAVKNQESGQSVVEASNPGSGESGTVSDASYIITAWYPDYDIAKAAASVQTAGTIINEINPVWYILNTDGSIRALPQANDPSLVQTARKYGMKIVPTIMNYGNGGFDPAPVVGIATDPGLRERHAWNLSKLVTDNGYDGIELDYENLPAFLCSDFTALVSAVRQNLPQGKLLSIDVYSKTSLSDNWRGPGAESWNELLPLVDRFKIMIYDYSWSTGNPGPIAPLSWTKRVLDYAINTAKNVHVSPKRIIVGMPLYGWDWPGGPSAQEAIYESLSERKASGNIQIESEGRDADSGEMLLKYQQQGVEHIAYYQDAETMKGRLSLLREEYPSLGGIALWRLGGEDPQIWPMVQKYLR